MTWVVLCISLEQRRIVTRFEIDAPSIAAVLDSGAIKLNTQGRAYDRLAIYPADGCDVQGLVQ